MERIADEELLARFRDGDRAAFEELVQRCYAKLLRFILRMLRNREDAEDVAQDALKKAWMLRESFELGRCFQPWIMTIARNLALNLIDDRKHQGPEFLKGRERTSRVRPTSISWTEQEEFLSYQEFLRHAAAFTEPRERCIFLEHHLFEMTYRELAMNWGLTVNQVREDLRRVRDTLRAELVPLGYGKKHD